MSEDLAWAAGLFDGEGSVGASTSRTSITASLAMCDSESVYRFHKAVGVGKISGVRRRKSHHKPQLVWIASGRNAIESIQLLAPWLSSVKLADYDYARRISPNAGRGAGWWLREKTICKYGHFFTETNTIIMKNGNRRCRECKLEYGRALWQRQHSHVA